ncbi:EthD domain-containing protein [Pseudonocardia ailaonensis]|uniref:EthD domain-containing protein n=1 Tax=Pseudonocardia ailaonensis TaxID=367279 RepID=UPI003CD09A1C
MLHPAPGPRPRGRHRLPGGAGGRVRRCRGHPPARAPAPRGRDREAEYDVVTEIWFDDRAAFDAMRARLATTQTVLRTSRPTRRSSSTGRVPASPFVEPGGPRRLPKTHGERQPAHGRRTDADLNPCGTEQQ